MKTKTEVIKSHEDLEVGELLNGKKILAKKIADVDTTEPTMVITYNYEVNRQAKKRERKFEEPAFVRIDMSAEPSVSGGPLVLIRHICRGM